MTKDPAGAARKFLEQTGLEPTLNRILVLAAVAGSPLPPTAAEVYETVLRDHRINRVTVYRILDLLAEKGVVNRIRAGERSLHFCMGHGHGHFHCTGCGKVQCLLDKSLCLDEQALARTLGMSVSSVDLHVEGLCAECSARDAD